MVARKASVEIVRGQISDRPWGQTLGALGVRQLTGQLTLTASDGKPYQIAFERGAVVGATSPLATDAAIRVALTSQVITPPQASRLARQAAQHRGQDELELVVTTCQLDAERALRLRQRVIAQCAARTFSVERGDFVVEDAVTIPVAIPAAVDIRAIVYLGARLNLADERLTAELRQLGSHFTLKRDALEDLPQFNLATQDSPVIEALRRGTTLPEIEARHRELDPRRIQSVIYALVSCFACDVIERPGASAPPPSRTTTPVSTPPRSRLSPPRAPAGSVAPPVTEPPVRLTPRTLAPPPATSRTVTPPPTTEPPVRLTPRTLAPPVTSRTITPPVTSRSVTPPVTSRSVTPPSTARTATPRPATRPSSPSIAPGTRASSTSSPPPARSTTSPPARTSSPSIPVPARTVTPLPSASQQLAMDPADSGRLRAPAAPRTTTDPLTAAAEAYARGQAALRDEKVTLAIAELTCATELNPHEFDYHAVLAWAQFCGAPDRVKMADKVRKMLGHAIQKSRTPELAQFYLGRMERMLGRDREALRCFQQVLAAVPDHADAQLELRTLETKLATGSGEKPGLASLFRKKT